MKEVTIKRFEKGDLIKGKKGNGYTVTNEDMTRGVVTGVDEKNGTLTVKVLEHPLCRETGLTYRVKNDPDKFELLPKVNNKAEEDAKMEITVVAEKGSELVSATVKYKGSIYGAHAECSPDDAFDLRMGASIAIGRAFDLMDKKAEAPKKPGSLVKIGDLVRITVPVSGGLKAGDLAEVIGIGPCVSFTGKPLIYVAAKTKSCFDGSECRNPGPGTLEQPFSYVGSAEYEILPEQPVRPKK